MTDLMNGDATPSGFPSYLFPQLFALCILLLLLIFIAQKLTALRTLLLPDSISMGSVITAMRRKAAVVAYGSYFLVFSKDAINSKDMKLARADLDPPLPPSVANKREREIRIIFVRHGESVWNYVFNRGFGLMFFVRLLRVTLHELCALPPRVARMSRVRVRVPARPLCTRSAAAPDNAAAMCRHLSLQVPASIRGFGVS